MGQTQSISQERDYFPLDSATVDALEISYTNLASESLGARVVFTSDESLGSANSLIKTTPPGPSKSLPEEKKDGWETRRHNKNPFHATIIQLACAGTVAGFDIDTTSYDMDHPAFASIEGRLMIQDGLPRDHEWRPLLPKVPLTGNKHHVFGLHDSDDAFTMIRIRIYPDGGVARLRVFGNVSPLFAPGKTEMDLACAPNGGEVIASSVDHIPRPTALLLPRPASSSRDGWVTPRSHAAEHRDWVIIRMGALGQLRTIQIDTTHLYGRSPDYISVDACFSEYADCRHDPQLQWTNILSRRAVQGDAKNEFDLARKNLYFTHVRLNIYPDGGVSRLRVYGHRAQGTVPGVRKDTLVREYAFPGSRRLSSQSMAPPAKERLAKIDLTGPSTSYESVCSAVTLIEQQEEEDASSSQGSSNVGLQACSSKYSETTAAAPAVTTEVAKLGRGRGRLSRNKVGKAPISAIKQSLTSQRRTRSRSASSVDKSSVHGGPRRSKRVRETVTPCECDSTP